MRVSGPARPLPSVATLALGAYSAVALAQPPPHPLRPAARSLQPSAPAAVGYLSGQQALVGLHAPSPNAVQRDSNGRPLLVLTSVNRAESLAIPATGDEGGFAASDLDRAAHLLRAAGGDEHPIDPRTLSVAYRIETQFNVPEIRVVSGYRVPLTGSRSNHGKGRAVDLIVPGVADEDVARFVRGIGFVGVGVYPASQFLHVDVRPRSYFWVDYSGPHARNRERGILGDLAAKSDAAARARGETPVEPFAIATDVDGALRARGMTLTPTPLPKSAPAGAGEDDEEDEEN